MYIDGLLALSAAQAVTATAVSTNTIDLAQAKDIGEGKELFVHFNVDTTATSGGSAVVTFEVISSAAADLSSPTVLGASAGIPVASLVAGYRNAVRINPVIGSTGQRYLGARYTVATANLTAGAFSANVVIGIADKKDYPVGFSVL